MKREIPTEKGHFKEVTEKSKMGLFWNYWVDYGCVVRRSGPVKNGCPLSQNEYFLAAGNQVHQLGEILDPKEAVRLAQAQEYLPLTTEEQAVFDEQRAAIDPRFVGEVGRYLFKVTTTTWDGMHSFCEIFPLEEQTVPEPPKYYETWYGYYLRLLPGSSLPADLRPVAFDHGILSIPPITLTAVEAKELFATIPAEASTLTTRMQTLPLRSRTELGWFYRELYWTDKGVVLGKVTAA